MNKKIYRLAATLKGLPIQIIPACSIKYILTSAFSQLPYRNNLWSYDKLLLGFI